jgi:hypothetical protein
MSKLALMERYQREADERASRRYRFAALVSCTLAPLSVIALFLAGKLSQVPWQGYCAAGSVLLCVVLQFWMAHYLAEKRALAWDERLAVAAQR